MRDNNLSSNVVQCSVLHAEAGMVQLQFQQGRWLEESLNPTPPNQLPSGKLT